MDWETLQGNKHLSQVAPRQACDQTQKFHLTKIIKIQRSKPFSFITGVFSPSNTCLCKRRICFYQIFLYYRNLRGFAEKFVAVLVEKLVLDFRFNSKADEKDWL